MPQNVAPYPLADADRLEVATDQAIAACDGDARDAVQGAHRGQQVGAQVAELQAAVSNGYARGRFELPRDRKDWYD